MYEQYIGKKYNNWTVIAFSHKDSANHPYFECICKCGKKQVIDIFTLKYNRSRSCKSCMPHHKKHGLSYDRIYRVFYGMRDRCYNPNNIGYKHYGARGITICNEWLNNVDSFAKWATENGYNEKLTIDRIDYDKGYSPENCRWADISTQANNKRNNHMINFDGQKYTISQFCKKFNLPEQRIRQRINRFGVKDVCELIKPPHKLKSRSKNFILIGGKEKSVAEWCRELNVPYTTILNRIKRYGYTPEQALTTPLKNGKKNLLLSLVNS